jgi:hypothetical protein
MHNRHTILPPSGAHPSDYPTIPAPPPVPLVVGQHSHGALFLFFVLVSFASMVAMLWGQ